MEPFLGQIMMFGGHFAIRGWALCDGQLLPISSNEALFSILGTAYGGDGRTTFGLPDMRGRLPMHQGQGSALDSRLLGAKGGSETTTLNSTNLPAHAHSLDAATMAPGSNDKGAALGNTPDGNFLAQSGSIDLYSNAVGAGAIRGLEGQTSHTGGSQPVWIVQPYQVISFQIALFGIYPSRA